MDAPALAVTFDFGQTLAELDAAMLARRLGERGLAVSESRLEAALPEAWRAYNDAIRAGAGGHPWRVLMDVLLAGAGVADVVRGGLVEWLWGEQPRANLWRRPVPGMIELVRALRHRGVPVAVVSNSEGRLAELAAEIGWADLFVCIADSGRLGLEKPDRAIFAWTAERLGVPLDRVVHVGDAYAADLEGALAAGMRAILFRAAGLIPPGAVAHRSPRARVCQTADEVRAALGAWGEWGLDRPVRGEEPEAGRG